MPDTVGRPSISLPFNLQHVYHIEQLQGAGNGRPIELDQELLARILLATKLSVVGPSLRK